MPTNLPKRYNKHYLMQRIPFKEDVNCSAAARVIKVRDSVTHMVGSQKNMNLNLYFNNFNFQVRSLRVFQILIFIEILGFGIK